MNDTQKKNAGRPKLARKVDLDTIVQLKDIVGQLHLILETVKGGYGVEDRNTTLNVQRAVLALGVAVSEMHMDNKTDEKSV